MGAQGVFGNPVFPLIFDVNLKMPQKMSILKNTCIEDPRQLMLKKKTTISKILAGLHF